MREVASSSADDAAELPLDRGEVAQGPLAGDLAVAELEDVQEAEADLAASAVVRGMGARPDTAFRLRRAEQGLPTVGHRSAVSSPRGDRDDAELLEHLQPVEHEVERGVLAVAEPQHLDIRSIRLVTP